MARVDFSDSTADVDWAALRAALVADSFDDGRTPEEYAAPRPCTSRA
jgi:hypothetical protein